MTGELHDWGVTSNWLFLNCMKFSASLLKKKENNLQHQ